MSGSSTCKSCGRPIVWAISAKSGKNMPIDAQGVSERGNIELVFDNRGVPTAHVRSKEQLPLGYTSHFVTCPQAKQHRRPR